MISKKIKTVRTFLGLTEKQISNIIFVNSYKYKRAENEGVYITTEMLVLLSIAYKVPLKYFVLIKYDENDLLRIKNLKNLKNLSAEQIEIALKDNLCSHFIDKRKRANSTTIDMIIKNQRFNFGSNIKKFREQKKIEIEELSEFLSVSTNRYKGLEDGLYLPDLTQLEKISIKLSVPIDDLIKL